MAAGGLDRGSGPRQLALGVLALAALTAFALPLAQRALVLSDEGFLLQQALELRDGAVLYRDLVTIVTPGAWLLVAGLFSVVEPSVFASRMLALAAYLVMIVAAYRIVASVSGRRTGAAAVATLAVLTVWAFPTWMLAWYSPFAVSFALLGIERLVAWIRVRTSRQLFAAGVLLALSIACKQNYGGLALAGALAALLAIRWNEARSLRGALAPTARDLLPLAVGGLLVAVPLFAYFAAVGAVGDLIESLVFQPVHFSATSDLPYLPPGEVWRPAWLGTGFTRLAYGSVPLNTLTLPEVLQGEFITGLVLRLHALLFWLPLPILVLGGLLPAISALREGRTDVEMLLLWLCCGALFFGVFPRADFSHLMGVYPPLVVLGSVVCQRLFAQGPLPRPHWARVGNASVLGVVGLYAAMAFIWYAGLLRSLPALIEDPRGGVRVSAFEASALKHQVDDIRARTESDEPVLSVPDLAMLNFLAERPFVGGTHEMYEHMVGADRGQAIVDAAESQHVRVAVARFNDFFSHRVGLRSYAPPLASYLRTHFSPAYYRDDENFMLLERRERPLPSRPATNALSDCDVGAESLGQREIRHHLLFDSLYHRLPPQGQEAKKPIRTTCRLRVPEGAALHLELGYRPPEWAESGASVTAFVRIHVRSDENATQEIFRETFAIDADAASRPQVVERRLDLSHLAGLDIALVFGTEHRGGATARPGDYLGFAAVWQDPRIVYGDE